MTWSHVMVMKFSSMDSDKMHMDILNPIYIPYVDPWFCSGEGWMSDDKDACYDVRMNKNMNSSGEVSVWFALDFFKIIGGN